MPLIDTTYFFGDLSIAQITNEAVETSVQLLIKQREPELLIDLFGYELYKNYLAGVATEQKYKDVRDGKEYTTRAGKLAKWRGLKNSTLSQSLIANYVYYWYLRDQASVTTGTGEKTAKAQNASNASPRVKMARAWNQMVKWNWELVEFLLSNDYPEFISHYGSCELENLLTDINPIF